MYETGVVGLTMPFRVTSTVMMRRRAYSVAFPVPDKASLMHFDG